MTAGEEPAYMLAARQAAQMGYEVPPSVVSALVDRIDRDAAMTNEHVKEAEARLRLSKKLRRDSLDPDAAGPNARKEWAADADRLLSEANVHATLAMAKRIQS